MEGWMDGKTKKQEQRWRSEGGGGEEEVANGRGGDRRDAKGGWMMDEDSKIVSSPLSLPLLSLRPILSSVPSSFVLTSPPALSLLFVATPLVFLARSHLSLPFSFLHYRLFALFHSPPSSSPVLLPSCLLPLILFASPPSHSDFFCFSMPTDCVSTVSSFLLGAHCSNMFKNEKKEKKKRKNPTSQERLPPLPSLRQNERKTIKRPRRCEDMET